LTVSIGNQTIALCIDARLSGDVTHLTLQGNLIFLSFIILAILRTSVQRVCRAHLRVIASRQKTVTCVNVEAAANRLQCCVRFGRSLFKSRPPAPEVRTLTVRPSRRLDTLL